MSNEQEAWKTQFPGSAAVGHVRKMLAGLNGAVTSRDVSGLRRMAGTGWRRYFDFTGVPEYVMSDTDEDFVTALSHAQKGEWGMVQSYLDCIRERW